MCEGSGQTPALSTYSDEHTFCMEWSGKPSWWNLHGSRDQKGKKRPAAGEMLGGKHVQRSCGRKGLCSRDMPYPHYMDGAWHKVGMPGLMNKKGRSG